jgi:nucleoside 2-deoxyribosyltransferase
MHIYVGYRYTGADKEILKQFLTAVSDQLAKSGHTTFMYFRDGGNWQAKEGKIPLDRVIRESMTQIAKADSALFLLQSNDFSEGMLLDIGCALALNKPVYLVKKIGCALPKTEALATKTIEYADDLDLFVKLSNI